MLFLSYARRDAAAVRRLSQDVEQLDPWYDRGIGGGQSWWDEILEQIRACELFVFLLSPDSAESKACRAELDYALGLGRPVLPIRVKRMSESVAPEEIKRLQIVDLADQSSENLNTILLALHEQSELDGAIDPATVEPPPIPMTDLTPLWDRLAAESLPTDEQREIVGEIRQHVADVDQQPMVLRLLSRFKDRKGVDLDAAIDDELDALVARASRPQLTDAEASRRADLISSVVSSLTRESPRGPRFTPILGRGLTDSLIGSRSQLARWLADESDFPFASFRRYEITEVAQFVRVMTSDDGMRSKIGQYLRDQLADHISDESNPDNVRAMLKEAWLANDAHMPSDPHRVLASLPCPVFVNAHPWGLLTESLREAGKDPVVELCRWKEDTYDWPDSIFEKDPSFRPTVEQPLVFHVFGALDVPDSLVITEDDYIDFVMGVTRNPDLLPGPVTEALVDSALLLLGFDLDALEVRVLMRTLVVSQEGVRRLRKYKHVAAQVDPTGAVSRERAQDYLRNYFNDAQPAIDIYWGSLAEFTTELAAALAAERAK